MLIINFFTLLMGLFLVIKGADILISSAVAIGKRYGVSDFFIGLIVIGFGTSLPELLVSFDAIIKVPGVFIETIAYNLRYLVNMPNSFILKWHNKPIIILSPLILIGLMMM